MGNFMKRICVIVFFISVFVPGIIFSYIGDALYYLCTGDTKYFEEWIDVTIGVINWPD